MPTVTNAGGTVGLPGGGKLEPGAGEVDDAAWDKVKDHPFISAMLTSGRLSTDAVQASKPTEATPTMSRKKKTGGKKP